MKYILKDLIRDKYNNEPIEIEYRTNGPSSDSILFGNDIYSGYCYWNGKELIPGDGDIYRLDDEFFKYEALTDLLVVWYKSEWVISNDRKI